MKTDAKRLGWFDWFVFSLLLLGVAGLVARVVLFYRTEAKATESRIVTFAVDELHARSVDCIEVGETVYFEDGSVLGVIESVVPSPAKIERMTDEGIAIGVWNEEVRCDVEVSVLVNGSERDGVFSETGGRALLIGDCIRLCGRRFAFPFLICGYKNA